MGKWSGLAFMLCLVANGAPSWADSSTKAKAKLKLPLVSPALVAADAARHYVDVRFSGAGISTISGAPLEVEQHPFQVKVRASVPALSGDEPSTVVFDDAEQTFVLRVSPDQLLSVLREPVALASTPQEIGRRPDISAPGIRIERGLSVRLIERSGAAAKIALLGRNQPALNGWVPANAVGPSFQAKDDEVRRAFSPLERRPRAKVPPGVSLRSKPDGGSEIVHFASLLESADDMEVYELKRKSGAALVVSRHSGWSATGWVSVKDVVAPKPVRKIKVKDVVQPLAIERVDDEFDPDALEGDGEEDEGGASFGVTLTAGTPLLASPGGEQIGWATFTRRVSPEETSQDAYRLRLYAPFGELDVWVSQPGMSPSAPRSAPRSPSRSAAPPPPPPPPPLPVVAPTALENQRIAGDKIIVPDPADQRSMAASGKTKLVTTYKLCVDAAGAVSKVSMLKSSGLPGYDAKISSTMKTWRYSPYLIDGVAKAVCTAVTFIYTQAPATTTPPTTPATGQPSSR